MVAQTEVLARQVEQGFGRHPDVEIYLSQPGLGMILGARVLAEFGDDPDRYGLFTVGRGALCCQGVHAARRAALRSRIRAW
jgi:hypothetical protein